MKYKVGDKFVIEIAKVIPCGTTKGNPLYCIKGFSGLVFDDYGLSLIEKVETKSKKEIDWSKVAVDTPVWVKDKRTDNWQSRHFAQYKNGRVYTWVYGRTSHTALNETNSWHYAKLAK